MTLDPLKKPFIKLLMAVEKCGHDEMLKGPHFSHTVLYGFSCQEEAISTVETKHFLLTNAAGTLDSLDFVKNHVLPCHTPKILLVRY